MGYQVGEKIRAAKDLYDVNGKKHFSRGREYEIIKIYTDTIGRTIAVIVDDNGKQIPSPDPLT